jgi:hypothetical protein
MRAERDTPATLSASLAPALAAALTPLQGGDDLLELAAVFLVLAIVTYLL